MKKIVKKIVKRLGYSIQKIKKIPPSVINRNPYLTNLLIVLEQIGFKPIEVVDIGANRGFWTRDFLKVFPDAAVTLIEPNQTLQPYFQDLLDTRPNLQYLPLGVGKMPGVFRFTLNPQDDSSTFLFDENEAQKRGFEQVEIPVTTLNVLLREKKINVPDLVKIDAEGLDLEVLEGASDLFGHTEIFMVEAAVNNPVFPNTFLKVIQFMDGKGYRLFDITDNNRPFKPKMLWLAELVFVKKGGLVDQYRISDLTRN